MPFGSAGCDNAGSRIDRKVAPLVGTLVCLADDGEIALRGALDRSYFTNSSQFH